MATDASPRAILVIRLSAIGDVVMASGMIPALRRAYPRARLVWLAEPAAAEVLKANPRLDEVIVWPKEEWRQLWKSHRWTELGRRVRDFRRQLRERHFDLVLDAHGLLKSGIPAWWTGAARRIGLGSREGSQWLMTEVIGRHWPDHRIGSEYRALMRTLGLADESFVLDVAVGDDDRAVARRLLQEAGGGPSYAAIAPFTTRPQKHWFDERWAELAGQLNKALELDLVMLGGPGDREAANAIRERSGDRMHDLVGRASLRQSAAIIDAATLMVGVDTGLTHMGSALRRPTIALFGATRPYRDPDAPLTRILYDDLPCAPCRHTPTCGGAYTCMRGLSVERVMSTARRLLEVAPA